jgi:hypothetical protein
LRESERLREKIGSQRMESIAASLSEIGGRFEGDESSVTA